MSTTHEDDDPGQLDSWDSPPTPPASPEPVVTLPDHDIRIQLARLQGSGRDHQARLRALEDFKEVAAAVLDKVTALADAPPADTEPTADTAGDTADTPPEAGTGSAPDEQPAPPKFDLRELVAWVRENVAAVIERAIPQSRSPNWCPQWWQHPEAIARLEAARRSWLEASTEPAGNALVVFWEHLDHQLGMLMADQGTFHNCRGGAHTDVPITQRRLPHHEPPESVYREFAAAQSTAGVPGTPSGTAAVAPEPAGAAGGPRLDEHLVLQPERGHLATNNHAGTHRHRGH